MKVSALIAATLLVASVSAQADNHGDHAKKAAAPAAKAAKAAKGAATTTTTTTTTTTAAAAAAPAADHMDCTKLAGKAKTECEMHEKAAHKAGETHAH